MPATVLNSTRWIRNQYDTAPPLTVLLTDPDGNPIDFDTLGITVTIDIAYQSSSHYWSPWSRIVSDRPCVTSDVIGEILFFPEPDDFTIVGEFHVKLTAHYPDGTRQTVPSEYPLGLTVHPRVGGP